MNINSQGAAFINKLYKNLHMSKGVERATREDRGLTPSEKIEAYMERLAETHADIRENENALRRLKELYYDKYVIKGEDVPESYFELQKRIALEQGHGHIEITPEQRDTMISDIIYSQKNSLNVWLSYFISRDADTYPMWFKYWAFQGVLRLGIYNKENNTFSKRSKSTVNPFVELNSEALALAMESIKKYNSGDQELEAKDLEKLLETGSFEKLYTHFLVYLLQEGKQQTKEVDGIWVKYNQGSDYRILYKSLEGKGTGWCTAGSASTAASQLDSGDFYVYYSYDEQHQPNIPRIAIRMDEYNRIAEVRGVGKQQNLEPEMIEIVNKKLDEFPDKEKYKQKVSDMARLTEIYNKNVLHVEFNAEELRFIYEIDREIVGFGHSRDPRIQEILSVRNNRKDLAKIFNCKESQISLCEEEALNGEDIIYHRGEFCCGASDLKRLKNGKLPMIIGGELFLHSDSDSPNGVLDISGYQLPEIVGGELFLADIKDFKGKRLPKIVKHTFRITYNKSIEEAILPREAGAIEIHSDQVLEPTSKNLKIFLNIEKWDELFISCFRETTTFKKQELYSISREELVALCSEHMTEHQR